MLSDLRFSRRWLRIMTSSGMLRRITLVRTDVSVNVSPPSSQFLARRAILVTAMMDATRYSETSALTRVTRRNIPGDGILQDETCSAWLNDTGWQIYVSLRNPWWWQGWGSQMTGQEPLPTTDVTFCYHGVGSLEAQPVRHAALVRTDVSEELSASFFRVKRIYELGTTKWYFFAACVGC
jgi:hypothetical protein